MLQLHKMTMKQSTHDPSKNQSSLFAQACLAMYVCLFLCYSHYAHAESTNRIVKWKDDKGVTHYGDRIPAQYSNRENSIINRQGVTIQHNKPVNQQEQTEDIAKLERDKKDRALLGAFTNAREIDLARDRNIQLDLIALENLQQEKNNSQKQLAVSKNLAANFSNKKKPIPEDLNADMIKNMADIKKIDQRITERKQVIEDTRNRFNEDKKRYLELKHQSPSEPAETPLNPTATSRPTGASNQ